MAGTSLDPIELTRALVRRRSVTPKDEGAQDVLAAALEPLGFRIARLPFGDGAERIENLYARIGDGLPHFSFAGHTDVVPPGDETRWQAAPFAADVREGRLYGRGTADMKGAIAAFAAAAARHLAKGPLKGSISLLITGDEEGAAVNGTRRMLDWLKSKDETISHCLVGEPTNEAVLGDMIKIGRRGSFSAEFKFTGTQGHVAYPSRAKNPIPPLVALLDRLAKAKLDGGTDEFQPSNLEIVTVDVGNPALNVIPAEARARFNIRFNDRHTQESLRAFARGEIEGAAKAAGLAAEIAFIGLGDAFITKRGPFTDLLTRAVRDATGREPALSTTGGTSDARFIRDMAPVVEFGLVGASMHKVDEHASVADIKKLAEIYERLLALYFAAPPSG
ncbi:MAG: succinyl-diaminopimelate desuccinylase [Alphaproteobacteria bacterium]